ncbi:MAG: exonuclease SbcCD subunit D C-terminal domain-containing protein [Bacteroidales bacterium]|nr:exonuclease SbcCD subunit D C-terminal domain-containing protein [Bacteroidales bacterium]
MKLLHTADWHLGKDLYGYDRKEEFEFFFKELTRIIKENEIDILLISGDVFDTASPGNATAKSYYGLINFLHSEFPDLDIVITGGNHDSPSYLNAPGEILKKFKTRITGCVLRDENGNIDFDSLVYEISDKAVVCTVPFLRRGDMFKAKDEILSVGDFYNEVVTRALAIRGEKNLPIIASGHLTTSNAKYSTTTGGEQVGGQDSVGSENFPPEVSYYALGHIHRPQPVDDKRFIRYSGSPLAFSFAEKDYNHSVTIVEFCGKEISEIQLEKIPALIPLKTVPDSPKTLEEVKAELSKLSDDEDMYLEVNLLQEFINPDNKAAVIETLKNKKAKFCTFKRNVSNAEGTSKTLQSLSAEEFRNTDPMKIIKEIYRIKQKKELDEEFELMLKKIIEEI